MMGAAPGLLYCCCRRRVQASMPALVISSSAPGRRPTRLVEAAAQTSWMAVCMGGVGGLLALRRERACWPRPDHLCVCQYSE